MNHKEIANRAGVNLDDLDCLLRGQSTANVARRLGVSMNDVETFIRGSASDAMTKRLGLRAMTAGDELARSASRDGAIGIILGLLIASARIPVPRPLPRRLTPSCCEVTRPKGPPRCAGMCV